MGHDHVVYPVVACNPCPVSALAQLPRRGGVRDIPLAGEAPLAQPSTVVAHVGRHLSAEVYMLPALAGLLSYLIVERVSNRGPQIASPDYSYLTPFSALGRCFLCKINGSTGL